MAKHFIKGSMAAAMLGDPAVVLSYATGLTSKNLFAGQAYSQIACLAPYLDGERILVNIPGVVQGITSEMVQEATQRLAFVRVRFAGLVLEIKGGEYNRVMYVGTADRAVLVQPGQK